MLCPCLNCRDTTKKKLKARYNAADCHTHCPFYKMYARVTKERNQAFAEYLSEAPILPLKQFDGIDSSRKITPSTRVRKNREGGLI